MFQILAKNLCFVITVRTYYRWHARTLICYESCLLQMSRLKYDSRYLLKEEEQQSGNSVEFSHAEGIFLGGGGNLS